MQSHNSRFFHELLKYDTTDLYASLIWKAFWRFSRNRQFVHVEGKATFRWITSLCVITFVEPNLHFINWRNSCYYFSINQHIISLCKHKIRCYCVRIKIAYIVKCFECPWKENIIEITIFNNHTILTGNWILNSELGSKDSILKYYLKITTSQRCDNIEVWVYGVVILYIISDTKILFTSYILSSFEFTKFLVCAWCVFALCILEHRRWTENE